METINRSAETFAERRKHERYSIKLRVCYSRQESAEANPVPSESMTSDLGLGGIALIAQEPLAIGQIIKVKLDLPALEDLFSEKEETLSAADKTVTLISRVVWTNPMDGRFLVGIQFSEMDHKDIGVLKEFLEEYSLYDSNLTA